MKTNTDNTPLPKPKAQETYIDAHGVERWKENDIKVSTDNAFRLGGGDAINYYDMHESAKSSLRASKVVEERRLQGFSEGTVAAMSNASAERLAQVNMAPQHWAVR